MVDSHKLNGRKQGGGKFVDFQKLLEEYQLEISDVRWYLARQVADKLLSFKDNREDITHYIWSGKIEDVLYNMEEKYIEELEQDWKANLTDESTIREILEAVDEAKTERTFT